MVDYPTFLYGRPAQTTIEAMMTSRVIRVTGQQLEQFFDQSKETMKLRAVIAEHLLGQFRSRYLDLHCTTARERYDLLMQRCPGIVDLLDLQDIASFLNVHPNTISKIRRDITFDGRKCNLMAAGSEENDASSPAFRIFNAIIAPRFRKNDYLCTRNIKHHALWI